MKRDNGNGLSCVGVSPALKNGRDAVESPAGLPWNQWPGWRGIGDRDAVEWVAGITWNMQVVADRFFIADKKTDCAVTQSLGHFGQRERDTANPVEFMLTHLFILK